MPAPVVLVLVVLAVLAGLLSRRSRPPGHRSDHFHWYRTPTV